MIIKTHVELSTILSSKPEEKKDAIVKPINEVGKKKNKKNTPAPVIEEISVVDEKIEENIDLSEWLKEGIEE